MLRCFSIMRRRFVCVMALSFFLLASASVFGQGASDPLATESMEKLKEDYNKFGRNKSNLLFRGDTALDPNDKDQDRALDLAARYTMYRFADPVTPLKEPGYIDSVFKDFEELQLKILLTPTYREKNQAAAQMFTKKMIEHGKVALKSSPIARLNAARVLERMTKLGSPELAKALL